MKKPNLGQAGFITLDFVIAFVLVFTFTVLLFAITLTFSAVEIAQYMTFAAARSYYAANISEAEQLNQGQAKFAELQNANYIKPLFHGGWYSLTNFTIQNFNSEFPAQNDTKIFIGARVLFSADVLNFQVPFFGSTNSKETFSANISSYLTREPSSDECTQFNTQRVQKIKQVYSNGPIGDLGSGYYLITDNGC